MPVTSSWNTWPAMTSPSLAAKGVRSVLGGMTDAKVEVRLSITALDLTCSTDEMVTRRMKNARTTRNKER